MNSRTYRWIHCICLFIIVKSRDDLKNHETDKTLFPDRPLASGKTEIKDFDKCIEEIYYMIMDLYSDFPAF